MLQASVFLAIFKVSLSPTMCNLFIETPMAVEQPVSTLSAEQVSLLLQRVLTKERLKTILVQESEEDKKTMQSLQEDLDGMCRDFVV